MRRKMTLVYQDETNLVMEIFNIKSTRTTRICYQGFWKILTWSEFCWLPIRQNILSLVPNKNSILLSCYPATCLGKVSPRSREESDWSGCCHPSVRNRLGWASDSLLVNKMKAEFCWGLLGSHPLPFREPQEFSLFLLGLEEGSTQSRSLLQSSHIPNHPAAILYPQEEQGWGQHCGAL